MGLSLVESFEIAFISLSVLGSLYIIVSYTRVLIEHGTIEWRAYLEVIYCISISDLFLAINYCFPYFFSFVLSTKLIRTYQSEGWPAYAYFVVPFGFFSGFASWLWLAFLPDAIRWTAFNSYPSPTTRIRQLHFIWLIALAYALFQSCIIFLANPDNAMLIRAIGMDVVGFIILTLAALKYLTFFKVTAALTSNEEDRSRFVRGLIRRAFMYMFPYVIMWIPTYVLNTICAIHGCNDDVTRATNLINGLQGFAHATVFWSEERLHDILARGNMKSLMQAEPTTLGLPPSYSNLTDVSHWKSPSSFGEDRDPHVQTMF